MFVPALSDRALSCSDITHVVCSHGHSDHVGNLNLFPEALLIVSFDICHGDTYFENGLAKVSLWYTLSVCMSQHQLYALTLLNVVLNVRGVFKKCVDF